MQDENGWSTSKPPNEAIVEVEGDGAIIRARAMYGRDGVLPHWESEDRDTRWHASTFRRWRATTSRSDGQDSASLFPQGDSR